MRRSNFFASLATTSLRFPGLLGSAFSVRKMLRFLTCFVEKEEEEVSLLVDVDATDVEDSGVEFGTFRGVTRPALFRYRSSLTLAASAPHFSLYTSGSKSFI